MRVMSAIPSCLYTFPSVVHPEVLLGIAPDDLLHLLVIACVRRMKLLLLARVFTGPEGVGDESFKTVPIHASGSRRQRRFGLLYVMASRAERVWVVAFRLKKSTRIPRIVL